jgi:hypothetical protein
MKRASPADPMARLKARYEAQLHQAAHAQA